MRCCPPVLARHTFVASGKQAIPSSACQWLLLDTANSAPGAQGLTTRMDERVEGRLDPAKVLSEAYHVLPTPCAFMCIRSSIPNSPRPPPPHSTPIPLLETAGGELKRLEGYETMLDDTSPSGTCDLHKKTAHHAHQHHPHFGPRNDSRRPLRHATGPWGSHSPGPLF